MTKEEARSKLCPFMTAQTSLESAGYLDYTCVCEECMAWQHTEYKAKVSLKITSGYFNTDKVTDTGYCKLINK